MKFYVCFEIGQSIRQTKPLQNFREVIHTLPNVHDIVISNSVEYCIYIVAGASGFYLTYPILDVNVHGYLHYIGTFYSETEYVDLTSKTFLKSFRSRAIDLSFFVVECTLSSSCHRRNDYCDY